MHSNYFPQKAPFELTLHFIEYYSWCRKLLRHPDVEWPAKITKSGTGIKDKTRSFLPSRWWQNKLRPVYQVFLNSRRVETVLQEQGPHPLSRRQLQSEVLRPGSYLGQTRASLASVD